MKYLNRIQILLSLVIATSTAHAKRPPPPKVPSLNYSKYIVSAPNTPDAIGKVRIVNKNDITDSHLIKIYSIIKKPFLEEDVQWIFISHMKIEKDIILVKTEDNKEYKLNLHDHVVKCKGCGENLKSIPKFKHKHH